MEWNPSLYDDYCQNVLLLKNFVLLKVTIHSYNFGAPVDIGMITPYMKLKPCFSDDGYLDIRLLKYGF